MDQNQQVLASAFRKTKGKRGAILRHGISTDLLKSDGVLNADGESLVISLAKAKAEKEGGDYSIFIDGQSWYILDLIEFSKMVVEDQLDSEYDSAFPNVASKDEMLLLLNAVA